VPPDVFVPLAEHLGLVEALDLHVLRQACHQGRMWLDAGLALRVAVNLSARNFQRADLPDRVAAVLAQARFPARLLEVELTETVAIDEAVGARASVERLRDLGARVAIDDFGTGYSMLGRLRDFPLDTLKIDKAFVSEIGTREDEAPIVDAIIALARSLRLEAVAEGVETEEQAMYLRRLGCDQLQGWYYGRPLPAPDVEAIVLAADERVPPRVLQLP
jgi:EAL domain-containing protein (putative c-di-GMP-specific phosphodiesterase class I)